VLLEGAGDAQIKSLFARLAAASSLSGVTSRFTLRGGALE